MAIAYTVKEGVRGHPCESCDWVEYDIQFNGEEFYLKCRNCLEFLPTSSGYLKQIEQEKLEDERENLIGLYQRKKEILEDFRPLIAGDV